MPSDPLGLAGTELAQYRIEDHLGGGGMGVVYRAHDTRLDRPVALKFLPALQRDDPDARRRFFVEARAASKLDHPNICTVYEIGETEKGDAFIAMAFYAGETLKPKIERGPLPLGVVLDLAAQIARGLGRAHAAGIVHRDIKPANVMVTEDGTAKVLDFGTAKVGDLDLTRTGSTVGTLRYMSPEQAEGKPVDARTDIWSLGALIYELLAGASPFRGATAPAAIYSLMFTEPVPLSEHRVSVPDGVEQLIRTCLAKDPKDRFQTADDLIAELERVADSAGLLTDSAIHHRLPKRRSQQPAGWVEGFAWRGAALAAVALLLALGWSALTGPAGADPGRRYVAVLPFTSSAPDDAIMAAGLTHSLTGMLSSLGTEANGLWVVPSREIVGQEIQTATQVREFFPVNSVVEGNLSRVQDTQEVVLNLVDAGGDVPTLISSVVLPSPEDASFQRRARTELSSMLGISGFSDTAVSSVANANAYPYYVRGQGYLARGLFEPSALQDALDLFGLAITEDPEFALAHAGLCQARWEVFLDTADRTLAEGALASCDRAGQLAGEDPHVLTTLGSLHLQTGEHVKAETALLEAVERDPDNAEAYRWLGRLYERQARIDEAAQAYRRGIELRPDVWVYPDEFAVMLVYLNRLDEAKVLYEEVVRLSPDNFSGYNGLGIVELFRGNTEAAAGHFRQSLLRRESQISHRNLAYINLRNREYATAITEAERAIELQETDWYAWTWLAHARHFMGDEDGAREAFEQVIFHAANRLEVNPRATEVLAALAGAHALLGNEVEAYDYLERLDQENVQWTYHHHYIGRAYAALGDRTRALESIERGLEEGYHPSALDEDQWLDALRTDPAYAELRGRYQPPPA